MFLTNVADQYLGFGPLISVADGTVITDTPANIGLAGTRRIDGGTAAALDAGSTFSQDGTGSPTYGVLLEAVDTNGKNITYTFTTTTPVAYPVIMTVAFWDATAFAALADAVWTRDLTSVEGSFTADTPGTLLRAITHWESVGGNLVIKTSTGGTITSLELETAPDLDAIYGVGNS